MKQIRAFIVSACTCDQGQDLIEYTLLLAFVALAGFALIMGAAPAVGNIGNSTNDTLSQAQGGIG